MNLPQFAPEPMRREDEQQEKEIWQPSWQCFCCEDRGLVIPSLAKLVIPAYDYNRDRLPICHAPKCEAGAKWLSLDAQNLDMRFNANICRELEQINRKNWLNYVKYKADSINKRKLRESQEELAQKMNLRLGNAKRTEEENRAIKLKKAEMELLLEKSAARLAAEGGEDDRDF